MSFDFLNVGQSHYFALSAIVLALGLVTIITRKNAVAILMGVELIINAALINLVTVSRYGGGLDGQVVALFGIVIAAAEAVVALAVILQFYRSARTVDATQASELKE